jgi:pimeloyl-ACP methyl ester carboxylesterase
MVATSTTGGEHEHERAAGAQLAELPGAGHLANLEQPARFDRLVRAFLAPGGLVIAGT